MNYPEPTEADLSDPLFEAVWQAIKRWDLSRGSDEGRRLYAGATGNDVMHVLDAVRPFCAAAEARGRQQAEQARDEDDAALGTNPFRTWKQVAQRVGEELSDNGPDGYYDFDPAEWQDWCLEQLGRLAGKPTVAALTQALKDAEQERDFNLHQIEVANSTDVGKLIEEYQRDLADAVNRRDDAIQALKDIAAHDGERWNYSGETLEPKPSPQEIAQAALAALTGAQA